MKTYIYTVVQIDGGATSERRERFENRLDFLEALNRWNRIGSGAFQYWEKFDADQK